MLLLFVGEFVGGAVATAVGGAIGTVLVVPWLRRVLADWRRRGGLPSHWVLFYFLCASTHFSSVFPSLVAAAIAALISSRG